MSRPVRPTTKNDNSDILFYYMLNNKNLDDSANQTWKLKDLSWSPSSKRQLGPFDTRMNNWCLFDRLCTTFWSWNQNSFTFICKLKKAPFDSNESSWDTKSALRVCRSVHLSREDIQSHERRSLEKKAVCSVLWSYRFAVFTKDKTETVMCRIKGACHFV